jgi:hypothetical protein
MAAEGHPPFEGEKTTWHRGFDRYDFIMDDDTGAITPIPWLSDQTRVVEKRYKELGGQITVIIREGEGHFPLAPKDPTTVVDFILSHGR